MAARLGLIGVGRWGKTYIQTVLSLGSRCRLTHLVTSNPKNAALVPYPVKVLADWRDAVRTECDAIIIATPAHSHAEILQACVDAGKACIVEKPLCLDVATAERLHERVQASGVPVLVDHTQLFNPAYQALKQSVHDSSETIRVILSEGMALGPFQTSGSALWEWCPHDFSLSLDLMGQAPRYVAVLGGPTDSQGACELLSVRLDFPNGVCAWIQSGRLSPHKRRNLSVFTERHLYLFDDLASDKLTVSPWNFAGRSTTDIPEALSPRSIPSTSARLPLANMLTYFLDGLAGGDRRYFGTALAVEVCRLLGLCEAALTHEATSAVPAGSQPRGAE